MIVTIKKNEKYFYLTNQDIKYMIPSGSERNKQDTEVHLKDGSILKILDIKPNKLDQLLMSGKYETLETAWTMVHERVNRNRLGV